MIIILCLIEVIFPLHISIIISCECNRLLLAGEETVIMFFVTNQHGNFKFLKVEDSLWASVVNLTKRRTSSDSDQGSARKCRLQTLCTWH
jgi:hypothetical protein